MKSLNEHLNEQLEINESINIGTGLLIAAGMFCIPNGLYAIYQLIKRIGTKGAYNELINDLDTKTKDKVKALKNINLENFPMCKKLIDAINNKQSYNELEKLYKNAENELRYALRSDNTDIEKKKEIEDILNLHKQKNVAKDERRIKWLISPLEFLSAFGSGFYDSIKSRHRNILGRNDKGSFDNSTSFGGGSSFGGGADGKW